MGVSWSTCTMRIARISDSGRKHRSTDLVPKPRAVFFLVRELEGCIIVTIGLPNPHRRSVGKTPSFFHPYIYTHLGWAFPTQQPYPGFLLKLSLS
jgi:hypothetical protein